MSVVLPAILVVIACKTVLAGPPDQNADRTGWENREWATEHSMMVCRRHEVELYDATEGVQHTEKAEPAFPLRPNFFDLSQCARAGIRLSKDWDDQHKGTPFRVWRIGCPVPIINRDTGEIVGYKLPECGHRDTVICETDSVI